MTLFYLAGAWLLGVSLAAATGEVWWPGLAGIAAGSLVGAAIMRQPYLATVGLLAAAVFVAGGVRYADQRPSDVPSGIAVHNDGEPVLLRALVSDEPEIRGRSQRVRLSVQEVFAEHAWEPESGGVLMRTRLYPRYEYGDVLELEASLETPPSFPGFDYRDYLARQGIVSVAAFPSGLRTIATGEGNHAVALVHDIRRHLNDALVSALPEPQAALAQGIVLGQRSAIPDDVVEAMNVTGTTHLIAISGLYVGLVAALILSGLAWLIGRRQAAVIALVSIAAYAVLTGGSPTVVRAAIMGGLFIIAALAGRPGSAGGAIVLAGAVMTAWQPSVILDVSFQLSFAAILGIVYLAPAFHDHGSALLRARGIEAGYGSPAGLLLESFSLTAAAVLATMPLIALYFERVSIVTFAANLLLVPAFPLVLGSSALTAVAGAVWSPLGGVTSWLSWIALTYMIEVAGFFADLPLAAIDIEGFGRWHAIVSYAALLAFAWWLVRLPVDADEQYRPVAPQEGAVHVSPSLVAITGLAVTALVVWWAVVDTPGGRLTVTVLDVGQGDAILIETPEGHHILIDGGVDGRLLMQRLGEELPFWKRSLDLVALTHPDEDHVAGLVEALARYEVRQVLTPEQESESLTYQAWVDQVTRQQIEVTAAQPGQRIPLGRGAILHVLAPDDLTLTLPGPNEGSLVARIDYGNASFLLTGDIEIAGEGALLRSGFDVSATVLKVPHHGSRTSSTPAFVRAVRPAVSVISAGEDNQYGHPSSTVLDRLADTLVLRTDEHGTVRLSTDGDKLWVETSR